MLDKTNWAAPENRTLLEPWRKLLLDAADLIERRGHCKRRYDIGARLCMIGALNVADHQRASSPCLTLHGIHAAWRLEQSIGHAITRWNDAPERTQTQVVAKLREVAAS